MNIGEWINLRTDSNQSEIQIQYFVDYDLDVAGYYALGHHSLQAFRVAILQQSPDFSFVDSYVEWTWAKFDPDGFEISETAIAGSQAITLAFDFSASDILL